MEEGKAEGGLAMVEAKVVSWGMVLEVAEDMRV